MLEIQVPLVQIFDMFEEGVKMMKIGFEDHCKPSKHLTKNGGDKTGSICNS